ncbi:MAG: hypothetical protein IJM79_07515 [Erysipelotrichaceae bacterium]|nr:hypothetical protein [Erysipelotrichaceae bacterium]
MKKVLILTSEKTGSGHKSSANAIEKKLRDAGYDCRQIDVFPLMGRIGHVMEDSYIPLTTGSPLVYYLCQRFSQFFPDILHTFICIRLKKEFLKVIDEYRPDLILSVHCMFTKAISWIIRSQQLNIPFYITVIDLIDPPRVWQDRKADMSFLPSEEVYRSYLKKGFDRERIMVSGFPVRDDIAPRRTPKKLSDPLKILMLNPSTDLQKNIRFLQQVSRLDNFRTSFICGLDDRLHDTLVGMQKMGELPQSLEICGFVGNVNEYLEDCQIVLTKAGPNAIIEAVRSGCAVVITGHINGQENHNYRFVVDNGYGIRCEDPQRIYDTLNDLIHSGKLKDCLEKTVTHGIGNGAEVIADYVSNHI